MHRRLLLLLSLLLLSASGAVRADDTAPPPDPVLVQRADKIVAALSLPDAAQATRVRDLVARQYESLRAVHGRRDGYLALARETPNHEKASEEAQAAARDKATAHQAALHYAFVAALAAELTPAQVDQIKDGMTYGVAPNTFRVYQEMLPELTPEQKRQLLAWLTEAREHAMDASTSDEKHAWFGKYKGRINNYLAKAGIDMKQAEKDLAARRKNSATK
jgi:Spy/CpxP family protein refolding chaperone